MRSPLPVAVQRLVVHAARQDAVCANPVDLRVGLVERPVERKKADRWVYAFDSISEFPAVHVKVVISA